MPTDMLLETSLNGEWNPWVLPLCFALFGACIGSFLNVVIYRLPLGLSVNEPKRSFCPTCKARIPWYNNLPIISWLLLRGKSACCHTAIAPRYWLVETGTALLFGALVYRYEGESLVTLIALCVWAALMLAVFCIDWEKMIVLPGLAGAAALAGLVVAVFSPWVVDHEGQAVDATEGLCFGVAGALFGFVSLKLVAALGRLLFGRLRRKFEKETAWSLRQEGEDLTFELGGEVFAWSELFMEERNRLILQEARVDGPDAEEAGAITFSAEGLTLPSGKEVTLESCESLAGTCRGMLCKREAMGSGDAWIALGIGALCGWQGVLFALVAGSFIGLLWALVAKVGRGKPMPFGPSLIAGAVLWIFAGPRLLILYWSLWGN